MQRVPHIETNNRMLIIRVKGDGESVRYSSKWTLSTYTGYMKHTIMSAGNTALRDSKCYHHVPTITVCDDEY